MALLNSYGSANRVVTNDKVVTYSKNIAYGSWSWTNGYNQSFSYSWVWEFHRYCTKQYKYVGMDLATAQTCAAAMVTLYTRSFTTSQWGVNGVTDNTFTDEPAGQICMAEVSIQ